MIVSIGVFGFWACVLFGLTICVLLIVSCLVLVCCLISEFGFGCLLVGCMGIYISARFGFECDSVDLVWLIVLFRLLVCLLL